MPVLASLALALPLAFSGGSSLSPPSPSSTALASSPYSVGSLHASTTVGPDQSPEDAAAANGWDEPAEETPEGAGVAGEPAGEATTEEAGPAEGTEGIEPAVPAPTTEPVPAGPSQVNDISIPARTGNGLLITAGILGAGGWAVMAARMGIIRDGCRSSAFSGDDPFTAEDASQAFGDGIGCVNARAKTVGLWVLEASFNVASWGIGGGGGIVKGQHDAARLVKEGAPKRNGKLFIGVGAGVLTLGVVGRVLTAVVRINRIDRITQHCFASDSTLTYSTFLDCYAQRNQLHFFATQFTSTAVGAGIGMLSYGVAHLKHEKNYRAIYEKEPPKVTFRVAPQLSRRFTGATLEMRF